MTVMQNKNIMASKEINIPKQTNLNGILKFIHEEMFNICSELHVASMNSLLY
jgi:hypothetical protein